MNTEALLVVDVQEEYIERYDDGLLKRINQRIEKAVVDGEIIIYIENIEILRHQEEKSPFADGLYIASNHVYQKYNDRHSSHLRCFLKAGDLR